MSQCPGARGDLGTLGPQPSLEHPQCQVPDTAGGRGSHPPREPDTSSSPGRRRCSQVKNAGERVRGNGWAALELEVKPPGGDLELGLMAGRRPRRAGGGHLVLKGRWNWGPGAARRPCACSVHRAGEKPSKPQGRGLIAGWRVVGEDLLGGSGVGQQGGRWLEPRTWREVGAWEARDELWAGT